MAYCKMLFINNIIKFIECEEGDYLNNLKFTYKDNSKSSVHLSKKINPANNKKINFDSYGYIKTIIIQYDAKNNNVCNI